MSINVMVVDDSFTMRCIIRKVLELSGLPVGTCLEAGSAGEALALLSRINVDLIITDLNIPGMSGIELIKTLKSKEESRHIPVIVVSTSCSDEQICEVYKVGVDGFLDKPFHPEVLCSLIRNVLNVNEDTYPKKWKRGAISNEQWNCVINEED